MSFHLDLGYELCLPFAAKREIRGSLVPGIPDKQYFFDMTTYGALDATFPLYHIGVYVSQAVEPLIQTTEVSIV